MISASAVVMKSVMVPSTPGEWELYVGLPKDKEAARKLASAVRKVFNDKTSATDLYASVKRHVFPVMSAYRYLGTYDTEPMWVLRNTLAKVYGAEVVEAAI